ncbi:MAG: hypothetical protein QOJ50_1572 [Cryptosporangiaceae bacterium]|nr:hypothetical protein [Cryptosporangiaceae bacterium]
MNFHATRNLHDALAAWDAWGSRDLWQRVKAEAEAAGNAEQAALAQRAFDKPPPVSALVALQANAVVIELLAGWQWQAVQAAREDGASWDEIGAALGITRQSAWTKFKTAIDQREKYIPQFHDAERARAALGGDPDGRQPGECDR